MEGIAQFIGTGLAFSQGIVLNFLLALQKNHNGYHYFTFADVFIAVVFLMTYFLSDVKSKKYPYIWLSWLAYVIFHIARIVLIYEMFINCINVTTTNNCHTKPTGGIECNNNESTSFTGQHSPFFMGQESQDERCKCTPGITHQGSLTIDHLRMIQCMSVFIFLALLFTHRRHDTKSALINDLTKDIAADLLDSVEILDVLIVQDSAIILPVGLDKTVIAFSCLNFILPLLPLIALNAANTHKISGFLMITYILTRMTCINISLMGLRIYLLSAHKTRFSVFLIKNAYYIYVAMREIEAHCCGDRVNNIV